MEIDILYPEIRKFKKGILVMAKEFSRYSMLVEWSEADGCFVVTVPELPGCMADGKTKAEAISMGEEAIKEWISAAKELGLEIPQPTICTVIK